MNTSQFEAKPEEVDHWTPYSHWCADCWHRVVDCERVVDRVPAEHHAVNDGWIQSLAYDRKTQRLEVRFRWKPVHPYRPVPFNLLRRICKARPMNTALDKFAMKNRCIHFDEVRSDGKLFMSLLRDGDCCPDRRKTSIRRVQFNVFSRTGRQFRGILQVLAVCNPSRSGLSLLLLLKSVHG